MRTLINFWLDVILLVLFLAILWSIFLLRLVFPPATSAAGWTLWGWTLDQWLELQFIGTCALGLAVLLHLMLHWTWVCGVIKSRLLPRRDGTKKQWSDGERTLIGVGVLVALFHVLGIALVIAMFTIRRPS